MPETVETGGAPETAEMEMEEEHDELPNNKKYVNFLDPNGLDKEGDYAHLLLVRISQLNQDRHPPKLVILQRCLRESARALISENCDVLHHCPLTGT